jgi:hypothetical protein
MNKNITCHLLFWVVEELWPVTGTDEPRLRMSENEVLREVTSYCKKLHNEGLIKFKSSTNIKIII